MSRSAPKTAVIFTGQKPPSHICTPVLNVAYAYSDKVFDAVRSLQGAGWRTQSRAKEAVRVVAITADGQVHTQTRPRLHVFGRQSLCLLLTPLRSTPGLAYNIDEKTIVTLPRASAQVKALAIGIIYRWLVAGNMPSLYGSLTTQELIEVKAHFSKHGEQPPCTTQLKARLKSVLKTAFVSNERIRASYARR